LQSRIRGGSEKVSSSVGLSSFVKDIGPSPDSRTIFYPRFVLRFQHHHRGAKVASSLSKAFRFRNKLVHFQDEELVIAQQRSPDDLDTELASGLADHPFVADLRLRDC
jgi:hypothetical protein